MVSSTILRSSQADQIRFPVTLPVILVHINRLSHTKQSVRVFLVLMNFVLLLHILEVYNPISPPGFSHILEF